MNLTDVVEIAEVRSWRLVNALLERGYKLIDVGVVHVSDSRAGNPNGDMRTMPRRHEYVVARPSVTMLPIRDALLEIDAARRVAAGDVQS